MISLTQKAGPLPLWGWGLAGTAAAGGLYLWERSKSNSSSASSEDDSSSSGDTQAPDYVFDITSQLPPEATTPTTGGTNPTGKQKGPFRRTSNGKQSLAQIAKSRHTTVAHIVAVTKASKEIDPANLKKFLAAAKSPDKPLPKGTVYYTSS